MIKLFPETPPIMLTAQHLRFLQKCLTYPNGVLQKKLIKILDLSPKTLSQIKSEIIRLGWCREIQLGSGKEIIIKSCKVNEVKLFLSQWKFLEKSLLLRPHSIYFRCYFEDQSGDFEKAIQSMTGKFRIIMSSMHNNTKYVVVTDYGKIEFHLKGENIKFWVNDFILPVKKEDVNLLEGYICEAIYSRVMAMVEIIQNHFRRFRIKIAKCVCLKKNFIWE